ncbi:MAG: TolC family protein [Oligoflexia bacterium]|nr:TolC family protein [Oligoflexia bacterium]
MRAALVAVFLLLPWPVFGETLTLEQCVRIAVDQATAVLQAENRYKLTATEVLRSYGSFLPNLNVGASYGYQSGNTLYTIEGLSVVNARGQNATLTVSSALNLFNGFADYSGLKASLAEQSAREYSLEWAKEQVALDITQTFLQVVLDEQLLDIARKNLEASQARLKLLQGETRVGTSSIADLYRQEAQTSADTFAVSSSEARFKVDRVLLVRKLRIDAEKSYEIKTPLLEAAESDLFTRPVHELAAGALNTRSDVQSSERQVESSDWTVTQKRSGYLPTLDLEFSRTAAGSYLSRDTANGVNYLTTTQPALIPQLGNQVEYTVGLFLSWNLFDRFTTRLAVEQARTDLENARIARDDSRFQLEADIRAARVRYEAALEQLRSAREGLASAVKSYEAAEGMYEVGSASIVDVLTAQAALVQARSNLAQASINLKLQEKTVYFSVGRLQNG